MNKFWSIVLRGIVLAVAATMLSGWCTVAPGEVVVVRRFGRLVEPLWGPGLHWRLPLGIDRIERLRSDVVRQITIGLAGPAGADVEPAEGEIMTGDLNLLRFQATVQFRVARPVDFVLRAQHVEPLLATAAEASAARALASRGVDAALRADRQELVRDIERDLAGAADRYQLGVSILSVNLTDVRPPTEVAADFALAQAAESERNRRINEAKTYEETTATSARAAAQAKLEAANAGAQRTVLLAQAESHSFLTLLSKTSQSRTLTVHRLYVETMQALLNGVKRKLILPPGGDIDLTVLGINDNSGHSPSGPAQLAPERRDAPNAK